MNTVNSRARVMSVLEGRIPDRVPVCLHNFLVACREAAVSVSQYRADPDTIARVHLRAVEEYGYDCILVDTDTTLLAEAMGAESACTGNEPGRIVRPAIRSVDEVGSLRVVNPATDGRIPALLEGIRLISKQVGGNIAIRGNADQSAFSLACLVRGTEDFLMELASCPDNLNIERLLEVCYASTIVVHRALIQAGADFTSTGDSLAGPDVISPGMFQRFAQPYEQRLVKELAAEGIFTVIHICGDTTRILKHLAQYDSCGFELDHKTDATQAKSVVGSRHVLFGNIDPSGALARGTPDEVRSRTCQLISVWKPHGRFVLNAGCAIPASTPSENLRTFVQTARKEGRYD